MERDDAPFGLLLGLAYQQVVTELHEHLAAEGHTGLRPAFGYAFKLIAKEPLTIKELATRLEITHQGAAKLVDEMVAAGYVDRVPDPADGRVKRLVRTERCIALMESGHRFQEAYEKQLTDELGEETTAAVRLALSRIIDRSDKPDGLARSLRSMP
ncbi:MarR family transcriptional regulator [Streptomyces sp. TRM66268-LWL]|uniref:MarR family transcriptional regulator n=1 Tax=Streptomyces polyasparticus TaxID=2767826 RepID=A0ABR7SS39_9ACTN|nr:MarR family transcriptional regulator [Streptomyces polyasparticus]MBC9717326.1 MarR family transcriptional regulator [Streptomyces polyasparticus]